MLEKEPKRIVVDLDDTICFPLHHKKTSEEKYGKAEPNLPMIETLQKLKNTYIIIYTARRMLTWKENIELIEKDVRKITEDWLQKYNVPYDELIFGKKYADYYIDDKAITPEDFIKGLNERN